MTQDTKIPWHSRLVFLSVCVVPILASVFYGSVSTGTLALLAIFVGLLVVFVLVNVWKTGEVRFSTNWLQLPILGLIVVGLIQLLPVGGTAVSNDLLPIDSVNTITLDPTSTTFAVIKLILFLIFFSVALVYIDSPKRLKTIVYTVIIFAAIMSFLGILQRLASPNFIYGMREVDYANPFASYVNQHHFAAFMEMTIGLTLALVFVNAVEKDKRLLLVIAVLLMGIAIIFTGSRGGFISLIGVIAFVVSMNLTQKDGNDGLEQLDKSKRKVALIGSSLLLIAVLASAVVWLGGDRSVTRIGSVGQPDFTNGRLHFWNVTLQIIRDNPILGAGLEAYGVAFTRYDTWNGSLRVEQAHNDYLQILADSGIIGFLCILAFVFLLFRNSLGLVKRTNNRFRKNVAIGGLAGCVGILVHSLFDFPLRTNANSLFFLLLVVFATATIEYPKLLRKPGLIKTGE